MTELEAELGAAYAAALIRLQEAHSFIQWLEKTDRFNACLYCKKWIPFGHTNGCRYAKIMESIKEFNASKTAPAGSGMKEDG